MANIIGTPGDDAFAGTTGNDTITGLGGNDTLSGLGGGDDLAGGLGNDRLDGGGGDDNLRAGSGVNDLFGGDGDDRLEGNYGDDVLNGGAGDDVLIEYFGFVSEHTLIDGGSGIDTVEMFDSGSMNPLTIDLVAGTINGKVLLTGIENVTGSNGSDTIIGNADNNILIGGSSYYGGDNDVLRGGAGDDILYDPSFGTQDLLDGGDGTDTADYSQYFGGVHLNLQQGIGRDGGVKLVSIENLIGTRFESDVLIGDGGINALYGLGGGDILRGGGGADRLDGGGGSDIVSYSWETVGVDVDLSTGTGSGGDAQGDVLVSIEYLTGSQGNDRLIGDAGANRLFGSAGDDVLRGGAGGDYLDGGTGCDTVSYYGSTIGVIVTVEFTSRYETGGDAEGDTLGSIENITGSQGNDTLIWADGVNVLAGWGGDDFLVGGSGADRLDGGTGADTVSYSISTYGVIVDLAAGTGFGGDAQGDTLVSIENITGSQDSDTLSGNAGANVLVGSAGSDLLRGGAGADRLDGGTGTDTATYYGDAVGVVVDLAAGTGTGGNAQGDTFIGIENVNGSQAHDTLSGNAGANVLAGWAGDDVLRGGAGADKLDGGTGADTASYYGGTVGVSVNLAAGTGSGGDAQGDTYVAIENVNGAQGNDSLSGNAGANTLAGWGGDDVLRGGAAADRLDGGAGSDTVSYYNGTVGVTVNLATVAGSGGDAQGDSYVGIENVTGSTGADEITGSALANALNGWAGQDVLRGGGGADRFVFSADSDSKVGAADRITDFSHAQGDRVDLSAIDANTGAAGNQGFSFIGGGAFTHQAGQLRATVSGGVTTIAGDLNGDGVSDFQVQLTGAIGLVAADFVL